jgi:hypothetical protein
LQTHCQPYLAGYHDSKLLRLGLGFSFSFLYGFDFTVRWFMMCVECMKGKQSRRCLSVLSERWGRERQRDRERLGVWERQREGGIDECKRGKRVKRVETKNWTLTKQRREKVRAQPSRNGLLLSDPSFENFCRCYLYKLTEK